MSTECAISQSAISSINSLFSKCNEDYHNISYIENKSQQITAMTPENLVGKLQQELLQELKSKNAFLEDNVSLLKDKIMWLEESHEPNLNFKKNLQKKKDLQSQNQLQINNQNLNMTAELSSHISQSNFKNTSDTIY